jgi:cytochrome c-type biogenesis protein
MSFDELHAARGSGVRRATLYHSVAFILGFTLVFVALGASATLVGGFLSLHRDLVRRVGAALIILVGLYLTGVLGKSAFIERERRFELRGKPLGYLGSLLVGVVFAFGWSPCIGPILASILVYASTSETVSRGMLLLGAYSLGLGLPFLASSLAFSSFLGLFARLRTHMRWISLVSGVFLIGVGVMIFFDWLQVLGALVPE